jgi:hypothetical protein
VLRCLYLFASCLPFTLTRAHFFLQARNFITVRYKAVSILQRAYLKQRLHRLRRVSDSERLSESLRCIPYRRETKALELDNYPGYLLNISESDLDSQTFSDLESIFFYQMATISQFPLKKTHSAMIFVPIRMKALLAALSHNISISVTTESALL